MSNKEYLEQTTPSSRNESEELYQIFSEATLVSDVGIEIQDSKLKKIMHSLSKSKNYKKTKALLMSLIKELSSNFFHKSIPVPTVSLPLTYSPQSNEETINQ